MIYTVLLIIIAVIAYGMRQHEQRCHRVELMFFT